MTPVQIPLELYANIADALAAKDYEDLRSVKSCSLTCHFFSLFVANRSFPSSKIVSPFKGNSSHQIIVKFGNLILCTPEIGHYVRKLDFCVLREDLSYEALAARSPDAH